MRDAAEKWHSWIESIATKQFWTGRHSQTHTHIRFRSMKSHISCCCGFVCFVIGIGFVVDRTVFTKSTTLTLTHTRTHLTGAGVLCGLFSVMVGGHERCEICAYNDGDGETKFETREVRTNYTLYDDCSRPLLFSDCCQTAVRMRTYTAVYSTTENVHVRSESGRTGTPQSACCPADWWKHGFDGDTGINRCWYWCGRACKVQRRRKFKFEMV